MVTNPCANSLWYFVELFIHGKLLDTSFLLKITNSVCHAHWQKETSGIPLSQLGVHPLPTILCHPSFALVREGVRTCVLCNANESTLCVPLFSLSLGIFCQPGSLLCLLSTRLRRTGWDGAMGVRPLPRPSHQGFQPRFRPELFQTSVSC